MKLVTVNIARSVWLFNTGDLNPRGLDLNPILAAVKQRYRFKVFPNPDEIRSAPHVQFGEGAFALSDGGHQIEISKFTIYSDGLVAETRHSTTATDKFLGDLLAYAVGDWQLAFDPRVIKRRAYVSDLVVSADRRIEEATEKVARFSKILSEQYDDGAKEFHNLGFRLGTDPGSPGVAVTFIFERQAGVPFSEERYYTQAPFTTEKHMDLLNQLEGVMVG
jgi:hypothetical protein